MCELTCKCLRFLADVCGDGSSDRFWFDLWQEKVFVPKFVRQLKSIVLCATNLFVLARREHKKCSSFWRNRKKAKHEVVKYFKAFTMINGIVIVISN